MNQQQRTFLIKKIEEEAKKKVDELKKKMPEKPSLSKHLMGQILANKFELRNADDIKGHIRARVLAEKEIFDHGHWRDNEEDSVTLLKILADAIFVIPKEYEKLFKEWKEKTDALNAEITAYILQKETFITRVQLSSDKVLQTLMDDIDKMGNISLMDTKLKLLNK